MSESCVLASPYFVYSCPWHLLLLPTPISLPSFAVLVARLTTAIVRELMAEMEATDQTVQNGNGL